MSGVDDDELYEMGNISWGCTPWHKQEDHNDC
jgi:hypothetical protein